LGSGRRACAACEGGNGGAQPGYEATRASGVGGAIPPPLAVGRRGAMAANGLVLK
jgi:hypothetical protein